MLGWMLVTTVEQTQQLGNSMMETLDDKALSAQSFVDEIVTSTLISLRVAICHS